MLTGCANSRGNAPAQPPTDISAALSETTEPPPETADDTYEAPNDLAIAAREAFIEHFRREGYLRLPANYQGAYFDEGDFVVQISDDDHSEYDFLIPERNWKRYEIYHGIFSKTNMVSPLFQTV